MKLSEAQASAMGVSVSRPTPVTTPLAAQLAFAPHMHIESPTVNVEAPTVNVAAPNVRVDAPTVNVAAPAVQVEPKIHVDGPTVNVQPADVHIRADPAMAAIAKTLGEMKPSKRPKGMVMKVYRDDNGHVQSARFTFEYGE